MKVKNYLVLTLVSLLVLSSFSFALAGQRLKTFHHYQHREFGAAVCPAPPF